MASNYQLGRVGAFNNGALPVLVPTQFGGAWNGMTKEAYWVRDRRPKAKQNGGGRKKKR